MLFRSDADRGAGAPSEIVIQGVEVVISAVQLNPGRTPGTSSERVIATLKFVAPGALASAALAWIGGKALFRRQCDGVRQGARMDRHAPGDLATPRQ